MPAYKPVGRGERFEEVDTLYGARAAMILHEELNNLHHSEKQVRLGRLQKPARNITVGGHKSTVSAFSMQAEPFINYEKRPAHGRIYHPRDTKVRITVSKTELAKQKHAEDVAAKKKKHADEMVDPEAVNIQKYRQRKLQVKDIGRHPIEHITLEPGVEAPKLWGGQDQKQAWDQSLDIRYQIQKVNNEIDAKYKRYGADGKAYEEAEKARIADEERRARTADGAQTRRRNSIGTAKRDSAGIEIVHDMEADVRQDEFEKGELRSSLTGKAHLQGLAMMAKAAAALGKLKQKAKKESAKKNLKPVPVFLANRIKRLDKELDAKVQESWRPPPRPKTEATEKPNKKNTAATSLLEATAASADATVAAQTMSAAGRRKLEKREKRQRFLREKREKGRRELEEQYLQFREVNNKENSHARAKQRMDERARLEKQKTDIMEGKILSAKQAQQQKAKQREKMMTWDEKLLGMHGYKYERDKKRHDKQEKEFRKKMQKKRMADPFDTEGCDWANPKKTAIKSLPRSQSTKQFQNGRQLCAQCGNMWSRRVTHCESCGQQLKRSNADATLLGKGKTHLKPRKVNENQAW